MLYLIVIFALLSIIPAGIVYLVLHTRENDILRKFDMIKHDGEMLDKISKASADLFDDNNKIQLEIASIKESFMRLSNKMASRARTERKNDKPDDEEPNQETLSFPEPPPLQQEHRPAATRILMRPKPFRRAV
jgi:hypothetical protein